MLSRIFSFQIVLQFVEMYRHNTQQEGYDQHSLPIPWQVFVCNSRLLHFHMRGGLNLVVII